MEARHVELERFARKADGYRAALEASPAARILELSVVGSIISGFCRRRHLEPHGVRIVDLMAGNGYLASYLREQGFGTVHGLEACTEMLPAESLRRQTGVTMHRIGSLDNVRLVLETIRPHVIVSLAGIHHLIHYEGTRKDRFRSILWQLRVIESCLQALEPEGLLLIVDIVEPDATSGLTVKPINFWHGDLFRNLQGWPPRFGEELRRTDSIDEYEEAITRLIGISKANPTLRWFREVVEKETAIGHEDVALSRELLELLTLSHRIEWANFSCPWGFRSRDEAAFFLTRKFGFLIDRKVQQVDSEKVLAQAAMVPGLYDIDSGMVAFGWNLGALIIPGQEIQSVAGEAITEANRWLIMFSILLALRAGLGWFVSGYFNVLKDWLDQGALILVGGAIAAAVRWWVQGSGKSK